MPLTLVEVCEKLKRVDEVSLMEMLGINSEDLVSRFVDVIEDKYEQLAEEVDDTTT
jgi:cell division septum initiation protein DivIVA